MDNKQTIDVISQIINGNGNFVIGKSRQTGKSSALNNWKKTFDIYNRRLDRKETIKRLFNI